MKKILSIFMLLVAIVIGAKADYKDLSFTATKKVLDGGEIWNSTSTNVAAANTAGWCSLNSNSSNNKKGNITPSLTGDVTEETPFTIDGVLVKGGNIPTNLTTSKKALVVKFTNAESVTVYGATTSSGASDNAAVRISVYNVTDGTSVVSNQMSSYASPNNTAYTTVSGLDAAKTYIFCVDGGFKNNSTTSQDVVLYAVKFTNSSESKTIPTITTNPTSKSYIVGDEATALTVAATAAAGGDLSYQWYGNTDGDTTAKEADKISGATADSYTPSTESAGKKYYYCVVTEAGADEPATSNAATIQVIEAIKTNTTITFSSTGASSNAVEIGSAASLNELQSDESVDDLSFTVDDNKRIRFGGKYSSTNNGRYVTFTVSGPCHITVYGKSNSSGNNRHINIGTTLGTSLAELSESDGYSIIASEYNYTGSEATSIYLFPLDSDYYLYAVKVTFGNTRSYTATIAGIGKATFSAPYNVEVPAGVKAYVGTNKGTSVTLTEIEGGIIPANTGVIIEGSAGSYTFNETEENASVTSDFIATSGNPVTAPANAYILGTKTVDATTTAVFKPAGSSLLIPSFKAYMISSANQDAIEITFDSATAIDNITSNVSAVGAKKYVKDGKLVIENNGAKFNAAGAQVK